MFIPNTLLQSPIIGLLIYLVFALVFIFVLYGIYLYSKSRVKNKLNIYKGFLSWPTIAFFVCLMLNLTTWPRVSYTKVLSILCGFLFLYCVIYGLYLLFNWSSIKYTMDTANFAQNSKKLNKQAPQIYKVPDKMPNIKNTNTTAIKPNNSLNTKENIRKNRELHGKK